MTTNLPASIKIKIDEKVYLKNPETSLNGQKIVEQSILLLDELGLEAFTFKKLAEKIGTTEATVYRYFDSKHMLLAYLIAWYWSWLEYRLIFATNNITSPEQKLRIAIALITGKATLDTDFGHVNEIALQRVVVAESAKVYFTKNVATNNQEGFFLSYKRFCKRVAAYIQELNPAYRYPVSLVSTVAETAHYQKFFATHLPSLTNLPGGEAKVLEHYLSELVLKTISR